MWSTGGENGNPFQYSCLENLMDSMNRQKYMTQEDEPPKSEGVQYSTGENQREIVNSSKKNEAKGQSIIDTRLWMCLMLKVKIDAVKNNIAYEPGMLGLWSKVNWMWMGEFNSDDLSTTVGKNPLEEL